MRQLLAQDLIWVDADGKTWALGFMTPTHRRNLLAWLRENAASIEFYLAAGELAVYKHAPDEVVESWLAAMPADPLEWMNAQPLVLRLAAMVRAHEEEGKH